MTNAIRTCLNSLAPKSLTDLAIKFAVFCAIIALWHVVVGLYWLHGTTASISEMILEATIAGSPFILLFLTGSFYQVRALHALTDRAYHDPLARVLNRQTFLNRLTKRLQEFDSGALILLDADYFKSINDKYGHAVGDRCIEAIGHRLNWCLRRGDLAGRIGGEEFTVFLPGVSEANAIAIAKRIGAPVSFTDETMQLHLTVRLSAGMVIANSELGVTEHLHRADQALYMAKSAGRARLCIYGQDEEIPLARNGFVSSQKPPTEYLAAPKQLQN